MLTFLFKIGNSGTGGCPAYYRTDRGTHVVQGYLLPGAEFDQLRQVAENETAVEIPDLLVDQIGEHWARERGLL
jgi:hypothetical protein